MKRRLLAWRLVQRAWRRSVVDEPVGRVRSHLEDARIEYAAVSRREGHHVVPSSNPAKRM